MPRLLCAGNCEPVTDLDEHARLVVGVGGENLLLLGGNGGVARDQHRLRRAPHVS
jgi:hypothetical protein